MLACLPDCGGLHFVGGRRLVRGEECASAPDDIQRRADATEIYQIERRDTHTHTQDDSLKQTVV